MKHENWEQVETIFHQAIAVNGEQRKEFLTATCSGDDLLLAEVESLITAFEDESELLEEPTLELSLSVIHQETQSSRSNTKVGIYKIGEKIGSGGMGEVYEAVDTNLNRRVALKFLHDSLANDNSARRLLVKEAQAAAALEHPNICAVYGIEQADDHHFIVMQYIEGKTLDESFEGKKIQIDDFKRIARQILEAVAFAHSHGVIHRDLKPGNIMVNSEGLIKVLDFGLAKVISKKQFNPQDSEYETSHYSNAGLIIGTVSYMSPEQLKGEKLDYQSDLFSVGIILYELISNQNPFNRQSEAETIAAILSYEPTTLKTLKPELPDNLVRLIERCLSKDKDSRFHSAAEILVELNDANLNVVEVTSHQKQWSVFSKLFVAIFALILLAGTFFYGIPSFFNQTSNPLSQKEKIAVLPFRVDDVNLENEYLANGLTQGIIEKLSLLATLKVENEKTVSRFNIKDVDPGNAGRELGVDLVLTGIIRKDEQRIFLETKLIRVADDFILDKNETTFDSAKLNELQENVIARIISRIAHPISQDEKNKLAIQDTKNPEAKILYLRARYYLGRLKGDDLQNAEENFRKAVDLDSSYAKAWAGLADTYSLISVPGHKGSISPKDAVILARAAAKNALEIDSSLCEPYVSLGMIKLRYDWDWTEAEINFREAISCNPELAPAHLGLSNLLIIKGRYDEALVETNKAKEFDPFSVSNDLNLARIYYFERDYERMNASLRESLKKFPNHKRLNYSLGLVLIATGNLKEATEVVEKIYKEDRVLGAAPLGLIYGKTGRKAETLKILGALENLSKNEGQDYISSQEKAIIYLGLGDIDKVFEYLNKACQEKFPAFPFVITDPIFDEISTDIRFIDLKKCANL